MPDLVGVGAFSRRRRIRARSATMAVLTFAVLAAVGCTAHPAGPSPAVSSSRTPAGSATPSGTATPVAMLPAGKVGPHSTVPWSLVGPGWTLVQYTSAPMLVQGATPPPNPSPGTLYLVDPEGGRYTMYTWPSYQQAGFLLDWSGDKTRALFATPGRPGGSLTQLELATGTMTSFTVPGLDGTWAHYTRPDGTNLLAVTRSRGAWETQRYNLHGVLQATFASTTMARPPIGSPDGTQVAIGTGTGVEIFSNAGGKGHTITVPGAVATSGCLPVRWWDSTTVLASCGGRLWLVPVTGAKPTSLTPRPSGPGATTGAWQLPSGLYVQSSVGCGTAAIARVGSDGSITPVLAPDASTPAWAVLDAVGKRLLVRTGQACPSKGGLSWLTPSTGATQTLIPLPATQQGVTAAVAYQGR